MPPRSGVVPCSEAPPPATVRGARPERLLPVRPAPPPRLGVAAGSRRAGAPPTARTRGLQTGRRAPVRPRAIRPRPYARPAFRYDDRVTAEDLVQERLQARDLHGAATVAIRELGPAVARYLRGMLRSDADAADAFSDWAESLWAGIGTFEGRSSFRAWAFRLAFNSALDLSGRAHRARERRLATAEASALADEVRTTVFTYERRRQRLDALRAELPADDQTLLFLRVDQQLPWDDVAGVLSTQAAPVDPATVRKRFERLKEKLRKLADERGLLE